MSAPGRLLGVLAVGDSAFPSGGFAFSAGLEAAHRAGHVEDEEGLRRFVVSVVTDRWATSDRVFLRRYAGDPSTATALAVDADVETCTGVALLRRASRRAGRSALGTFAALGHPDAVALHREVGAGRTPGHLVVVQAVGLRAAGLAPADVEVVSGWNLVSQVAAAGLRLGLCGHLGAQRVITAGNDVLARVLTGPPPAEPSTATPLLDVLAARHVGDGRLFAG